MVPKTQIREPKKEPESPSPWIEEGEQASLFGEPEKPKQNQAPSHQQKNQTAIGTSKKIKAEQQNLFGEEAKNQQKNQSPKTNQSEENESEEEKVDPKKEDQTKRDEPKSPDDKAFGVGEVIDLDI